MTIQAFCFTGQSVTYAGLHQEVMIYRAASRHVEVDSELSGSWIGLVEDVEDTLVDKTLHMARGDAILMYTDGLTESKQDGRLLDVDGLSVLFEQEASRGLEGLSLIESILHSIDHRMVDDDVSVMLVQCVDDNERAVV